MGALEDRIASAREKKAAEEAAKVAEVAAEKQKKDEAEAAIAARANLKDRVTTALSDRSSVAKKNLQNAKQAEDFMGTLHEMMVASENAQAETLTAEKNAEVDAGVAELKGFGEEVSDEEVAAMRAEKLEPIEEKRKKEVDSISGGMLGEIINASKKVGENTANEEGLYEGVLKSVDEMDEGEHSAISEALKTGGPEALAKFHGARTERLQKMEAAAVEKRKREEGVQKTTDFLSKMKDEFERVQPEVKAIYEKISKAVEDRLATSPEIARVQKEVARLQDEEKVLASGFNRALHFKKTEEINAEIRALAQIRAEMRSIYQSEEMVNLSASEKQNVAVSQGRSSVNSFNFAQTLADSQEDIMSGRNSAEDILRMTQDAVTEGERSVLEVRPREYQLANTVRERIQQEARQAEIDAENKRKTNESAKLVEGQLVYNLTNFQRSFEGKKTGLEGSIAKIKEIIVELNSIKAQTERAVAEAGKAFFGKEDKMRKAQKDGDVKYDEVLAQYREKMFSGSSEYDRLATFVQGEDSPESPLNLSRLEQLRGSDSYESQKTALNESQRQARMAISVLQNSWNSMGGPPLR